jgi:stearoyl-CoA desaturase (delta-9 desaturase)
MHDDEHSDIEVPDTADPFPFTHDSWGSKLLVLAFVILPLLAFGYGIYALWGHQVGWLEIGLFLGMWTFTGLGISLGFHRMLTHRAFSANAPTRAILLVSATMAMQGPAADWAATHIRHHAKADKEGDPHSPLEGFWHAHFGWLLRDRFVRGGLAHEKLMADPVTAFVSKTWVVWATLGIMIPGLIAMAITHTWMGFLDGVLWGGFVRVFIGHHITWSVNSVAHIFGTRPFKTPDEARNNGFVALFSWGEGWHNNHHAFPRAAYIGMKWWQLDIGKYLIKLLALLGQIKNVWNPSRAEKAARRRSRRAPVA